MSQPAPAATRVTGSAAGPPTAIGRGTAEAVVEVANRAPSIHNTQPWRWELHSEHLSLRADRDRQLLVADPDGHSLLISCGAALALTELGLRALGWQVETRRLPEDGDPDLLAEFRVTGPRQVSAADTEVVTAAQRRQSDRRPFQRQDVPPEMVEQLRSAAAAAGVHADFPDRAEQRVNLAVAVSWADRTEAEDPAYVAEMNRWLRDSDVHSDGVPTAAVPKVPPGLSRHTEVPLRDFEKGVSGRLLIERDVDEKPLIAVLLTDSDSALERLRAGEAMMRLMLEAELLGLAACPLSQAVDLLAFRSRVQTLMGWQGVPQMMLRLGYPAAGDLDAARTPRRPTADVLTIVTS